MPTPSVPQRQGYIPSLDGWRAIAILGVLLVHDLKPAPALDPFRYVSGFGVDLFFAISGILITTRILEEESLCGFFDIKRFYIRRVFRIQPAAWLYLAVIACLLATSSITMLWRHWFGAAGMYENFIYPGPDFDDQSWFVGHFWTLAVEEHFYILLSLLLLVLKRYRVATLVCLLVGLTAFRAYAVMHGHANLVTWRRTYYQLPGLVYAACFAVALRKESFRSWAENFLKPWFVFSATVAVIIFGEIRDHLLAPSPIDFHPAGWASEIGIVHALFAFWIIATMLHADSLSTRFLEWAPLRWIGRLSYSLYLWHVLFFFRLSPRVAVSSPLLLALSGRPAKYFAALAAAALSYYLVEKPLMRLGHRLAPPATPGRADLMENPPGLLETTAT